MDPKAHVTRRRPACTGFGRKVIFYTQNRHVTKRVFCPKKPETFADTARYRNAPRTLSLYEHYRVRFFFFFAPFPRASQLLLFVVFRVISTAPPYRIERIHFVYNSNSPGERN